MTVARPASRLRSKFAKASVLLRAKLLHPLASGDSPYRIFAGYDDDTWWWANTAGYRRFAALRRFLPSLPDEPSQERFMGAHGDVALAQAFMGYRLFRRLAAEHGHPIGPQSRVLDFGCGWGRLVRWFLRDVPAAQLCGVDCMPLAIEWCRRTNRWCLFEDTPALPPTGLPSGSFDLIYAYSVFSHLSEPAADAWVSEFRRLLAPGGLLVITTRPRDFLLQCERYRRGEVAGYEAMGLAFEGVEGWLVRYDRGEYCYAPTGGGDNLDAEFYGEACIPVTYARRCWADRLPVVAYLPWAEAGLDQDVIACRRE